LKDFDSQSLLGSNHGLHAVVHVLDEVNFGTTQSAKVGNVVNAIVTFSVLSVGSTDLDIVLVSD
jgi:hypothetical protein